MVDLNIIRIVFIWKTYIKTLLELSELLNDHGTLLDAWCGDGFWSEFFSEYYETTGEDISKGGIYIANKKS